MKTLKFEDLKLPEQKADGNLVYLDSAIEAARVTARAVWQQMRDHYEQPAQEWRLPDPPPGQQWHRTDWTQDMLPEGYRPLLLGEVNNDKDEGLCKQDGEWALLAGVEPSQPQHTHLRTRRPLPAPVEYVPLEPGDIQPGSVVRCTGATWWKQVTGVRAENITVCAAGNLSWQALADSWEILRPGSTTWEPCKKPKP